MTNYTRWCSPMKTERRAKKKYKCQEKSELLQMCTPFQTNVLSECIAASERIPVGEWKLYFGL